MTTHHPQPPRQPLVPLDNGANSRINRPDWQDTLLGTDMINIMTPPLFTNPLFGVAALFMSFTVAGSLTGHYDRQITRDSFDVHGVW